MVVHKLTRFHGIRGFRFDILGSIEFYGFAVRNSLCVKRNKHLMLMASIKRLNFNPSSKFIPLNIWSKMIEMNFLFGHILAEFRGFFEVFSVFRYNFFDLLI